MMTFGPGGCIRAFERDIRVLGALRWRSVWRPYYNFNCYQDFHKPSLTATLLPSVLMVLLTPWMHFAIQASNRTSDVDQA